MGCCASDGASGQFASSRHMPESQHEIEAMRRVFAHAKARGISVREATRELSAQRQLVFSFSSLDGHPGPLNPLAHASTSTARPRYDPHAEEEHITAPPSYDDLDEDTMSVRKRSSANSLRSLTGPLHQVGAQPPTDESLAAFITGMPNHAGGLTPSLHSFLTSSADMGSRHHSLSRSRSLGSDAPTSHTTASLSRRGTTTRRRFRSSPGQVVNASDSGSPAGTSQATSQATPRTISQGAMSAGALTNSASPHPLHLVPSASPPWFQREYGTVRH